MEERIKKCKKRESFKMSSFKATGAGTALESKSSRKKTQRQFCFIDLKQKMQHVTNQYRFMYTYHLPFVDMVTLYWTVMNNTANFEVTCGFRKR